MKRKAQPSEPMVDIGRDNLALYVPLKDYLRLTQTAIAIRRDWVGGGKGVDGTDYRETYVENVATNLPALKITRRDILMAQAVAAKLAQSRD